LRQRLIDQRQHVRTAGLNNPDGLHACRQWRKGKACVCLAADGSIEAGSNLMFDLTRHVASMINALTARRPKLAAGTSIAASALPDHCATHGIRFCDRKPPRLPSVVMAAMAA